MNPKKRKHAPYLKLEGFKKEHGLTNADIAKTLNISEAAVIMKNRGSSDYYISEVKALIEAYQIPIQNFLP